jgi:hypothetical protein
LLEPCRGKGGLVSERRPSETRLLVEPAASEACTVPEVDVVEENRPAHHSQEARRRCKEGAAEVREQGRALEIRPSLENRLFEVPSVYCCPSEICLAFDGDPREHWLVEYGSGADQVPANCQRLASRAGCV